MLLCMFVLLEFSLLMPFEFQMVYGMHLSDFSDVVLNLWCVMLSESCVRLSYVCMMLFGRCIMTFGTDTVTIIRV
jgi:hypothetical protein